MIDTSKVHPYVLQGGGLPSNWTRFAPNTYSPDYRGIVAGPDKNMWFLDATGPGLVKLTMTGNATEYPLPIDQVYELNPEAIALAPSGRFYILTCVSSGVANSAVEVVNRLGRGPAYQLPAQDAFSACTPEELGEGPDGNAWFVGGWHIDKVTPSGTITQFAYPNNVPNSNASVVAGPGGLLWFIDSGNDSLDSIDTNTGQIVLHSIGQNTFGGFGLAAPKDGNLWFACIGKMVGAPCGRLSIAKMTPAGQMSTYPVANEVVDIAAGTVGPDKAPYFLAGTFITQNNLLRVDVSNGQQTLIASHYNGSEGFFSLAGGPDGNVWITDPPGNIAVYIRNVLSVIPTTLNFASSGLTGTLIAKERGSPTLNATSSNVGVATVVPDQQQNTFTVESKAVGSCVITIQDAIGNSFNVPVTVQ
ncbi:MAG TPA: hypothetical protein VEV38_13880 [Candidatus Eremiobacteraceae bacterium]|nr:hypothetical protein [Candidatus Eremiobacteraceae bacterium]